MILGRENQTIIAQATPTGKGAIALLRVSGPQSREIISKISKLKINILEVASHTIHYGHIINSETKELIDTVLFFIMDEPRSFTGQDTIEISCHNNIFIIENIISEAIKHGARIAQPGEFTERAFLNGKIDLVQAEAINDLINANTQFSLKKALSQLNGSFSKWLFSLEESLVKVLAWSEASFEFLEEHENGEYGFTSQIQNQINEILQDILIAKNKFGIQQQLRLGIKIAIIGSVNSGKSSLFNALLGEKRAIVTNIPGTTRDTIESSLYKNGNYWTLIDTAGLRETDNIIEQEGIERSFQEAEKSDIIILVYDSSKKHTYQESEIYRKLSDKYNKKIINIYNKSDSKRDLEFLNLSFNIPNFIFVSTVTKENIDILDLEIQKKIDFILEKADSPFLLNKRQFNLLLGLEKILKDILDVLVKNSQPEIISYHIKYSLEYITELTGQSISEKALDKVFREFCIGK